MASTAAIRRFRPASVAATIAAGGIGLGVMSKLLVGNASAESDAPPKVFGAGPAFVSLPLESSEQMNHNTKRLRFKLPQREAVSGLGNKRPDDTGYLELLVKKYPDGKQSTHLHSMTPGQTLLFALAIKGHQWKPNSYPHVTLIAGGAGITPIYQLAQGILRNPLDKTAITLVFGVNSDPDVLLKKELEQFEKEFPGRFRAVYTVSNPAPNSPLRKGYVTKELLQEVGAVPKDGAETKVFVCGPPAMEAALVGKKGTSGILQQLGYRKDQIHQF
ncbi:NADH-cytochrome b5 reductase [Colletotrichum higginsianum]|nr:NADH-cytochrome b5 reductase [Colletotrichum higginsianum]